MDRCIDIRPYDVTRKDEPSRRAVLHVTNLAMAAAAMAALPSISTAMAEALELPTHGPALKPDPILALVAEAERLLAEGNAASARATAIREAAGGALDGGWPTLDLSRPEFEPMRTWFAMHHPDGRAHRIFIEDFNAHAESIVAEIPGEEWGAASSEEWEKRHAEGLARLAHWDDIRGRYERLAESSGYFAAIKRSEALYSQYGDVVSEIAEAQAVTIEGAMAQLATAAHGITEHHTLDGEFTGDVDDVGVLNAYEALTRLLPALSAA